ncbi:GNAT family N-acetyltransferase [Frigoriflavimonas asaccharolytica]|uniref:RimJ/RimL family protein N-acetyltransferase n=1 Tax=Frigoriflavimonas asaccharolytica TaxID=2735899 RepID=A0A8J8GAG9_9FLAO|nr:GNAT family N-acetyltransferase [Frigoriflavimonas asaccharolytica]NRS94013.1 RimJ/RimL family protein N-acetyltransferase [Frigoriflavimonas asaccharolytica]
MENYTIETSRLLLNFPTKNDLESFLFEINSTDAYSKNLFSISYPFSAEQTNNWFEKCQEGNRNGLSIRFAIREKEVGKLFGIIGIHINKEHQKAELGYWLGKNYWGKGYISEGLTAVIKFGFEELELNKIVATHFLFNPASGKAMQNAGMKLEGLQLQEYLQDGQFLDVKKYYILKEDVLF